MDGAFQNRSGFAAGRSNSIRQRPPGGPVVVAIPIGADYEGSRWAGIRPRVENAKRSQSEPAMPVRKRPEMEEVLRRCSRIESDVTWPDHSIPLFGQRLLENRIRHSQSYLAKMVRRFE